MKRTIQIYEITLQQVLNCFMKRYIFFCVVLFSGYHLASQNISKCVLNIVEADSIFLHRNACLLAKHYDIHIAQAQVLQARLFDNPVISFDENLINRDNHNRLLDFGPMSEQTVDIEQEISLAGKRNKRVLLAKVNAEMAQYQYMDLIRTLHTELRTQYIKTYFDLRKSNVYDEEIQSLSKLVKVMSAQADKGNLSQMELVRLKAELLSLKKEKNDIDNDWVNDSKALNLLLGFLPNADIEPMLDESVLGQVAAKQIDFVSIDSTVNERPDVKSAIANIDASRINLRLQKAMAAPNLTIKGSYDRRGSAFNNFFSVGVGVAIPLFDRNQGNIKAAKYSVQQSVCENDAALMKAHSELYEAFQEYKNAVTMMQSSETSVEKDFDKLLSGLISNFSKRNINMVEFLDYYESYKNTRLQLYDIHQDVFLKMENVNAMAGRTIFGY